jgi:hypothetical protein
MRLPVSPLRLEGIVAPSRSEEVRIDLATMGDRLDQMSQLARALLDRDGTDQEGEAWFADARRREIQGATKGRAMDLAYAFAGRYDLNWRGLARYWRPKSTG